MLFYNWKNVKNSCLFLSAFSFKVKYRSIPFQVTSVVPCAVQWRCIPLSVGVILRPKSACLTGSPSSVRPRATQQQQQQAPQWQHTAGSRILWHFDPLKFQFHENKSAVSDKIYDHSVISTVIVFVSQFTHSKTITVLPACKIVLCSLFRSLLLLPPVRSCKL